MIIIDAFIKQFSKTFPNEGNLQPWEITENISKTLYQTITGLDNNYEIKGGIAVHNTATIEKGAILKAPAIICENCFIGAHAYLRGGVYIGSSTKVGPSCEIKSSILLQNISVAHFNFIGDSIIGNNVNFEAGALIANHYNEREIKTIFVLIDSITNNTGVEKFGSLVGDDSKIGANSVLSPGTILKPNTIVKRLELIEQNKNY
ncbi:MAG: LpxA family transferase [Cyclobacteriaceae bacterium]|nr:LpxA family transferase [Cyclobacteriaceae bacterium]